MMEEKRKTWDRVSASQRSGSADWRLCSPSHRRKQERRQWWKDIRVCPGEQIRQAKRGSGRLPRTAAPGPQRGKRGSAGQPERKSETAEKSFRTSYRRPRAWGIPASVARAEWWGTQGRWEFMSRENTTQWASEVTSKEVVKITAKFLVWISVPQLLWESECVKPSVFRPASQIKSSLETFS